MQHFEMEVKSYFDIDGNSLVNFSPGQNQKLVQAKSNYKNNKNISEKQEARARNAVKEARDNLVKVQDAAKQAHKKSHVAELALKKESKKTNYEKRKITEQEELEIC